MRSSKFNLLIVLALVLGIAQATTITGNVVGVSDGDTVTILDANKNQHKIRLAGIDAPEKKQPFGQRSKQSLSDLTFHKQATVETYKTDRYGRAVGVLLVDGRDVSLLQIERGMAWWYRDYAKEQSEADRRLYMSAETAARAGKAGLWGDVKPVPPWEFRKGIVKAP